MAKGESRKNARAPKRSGSSPKQEALDQFRVSADGEHLTTDQGLRINDDQNSLKAGDRGPSLLEDFILREKITHFDHERIPERVVHARGAGAHGYFQVYESLSRYTKAKFLQDPVAPDAGLRALLDGGGLPGIERPRARRPRLRRQVLHAGGELRSRREQHPGLLHPGRRQVPRPGPRGEAGAAQRDAAGGVGARHVLGLHLAHAGIDAHDHVGDVRPRHSPQLPDDGGLRRPHVPPGRRARARPGS